MNSSRYIYILTLTGISWQTTWFIYELEYSYEHNYTGMHADTV